MTDNLILESDSYKLTHWPQYRKGTTKVSSYMESRGGKFPATLWYGATGYLDRLSRPITRENIEEAEDFSGNHFGRSGLFNSTGWKHILNKHGGHLPLEIKMVPEGSVIPTSNVLMTIENTDEEVPWLTNYVETPLMKIWAPTTVATNSFYSKKLIMESMVRTGCDLDGLIFKLHCFGYRGVSSEESAGILGSAHLVNFWGTDTVAAIRYVLDKYKWDPTKGFPGYSVPASEHSIATPFGPTGEAEYVLHMLECYPEGNMSAVADSYNVYEFARMLSQHEEIKEKILNRKGGAFVVRPDSGDPCEVLSQLFEILWNGFGGTYTKKGFKSLKPCIRVLQGDGIDFGEIDKILKMMEANNWATDNIIFGSGGGLLQKFDRDTQKFAIKCSSAIIDGVEVDVQKNPITSTGKKSKAGRLKLLHTGVGKYMTISSTDNPPAQFNGYIDELKVAFRNGDLRNQQNFHQIRERAEKHLRGEWV